MEDKNKILRDILAALRTMSGGSGAALATEATLQDVRTAVQAIKIDADSIVVDADTINLNTDTLESLATTGNTNTSDIKTSVEIMDDWDESDRAKVNLIAGQAGVQGGSGAVSANTQRVVLATDVALPAGETHIGAVGGNSDKIQVTPTVSTSPAYTSGDNVGGIMTITNAVRVSGGTALLEDITIWDKDNQNAVFEIDFWNASPSGTYTDNSAQVSAGDHAKYLGTVKISAADYSTTGAISRVNIKTINMLIKASGSANIFATVKTTGTPTYTTTSALVFSFGFLQD